MEHQKEKSKQRKTEMKNQVEKTTGRQRALGAFTALYVALPPVMIFVAYGVTMWMATQEKWKDCQVQVILIALFVLPVVGAIIAALFNRALGVWYSRRKQSFHWTCAAIGGVAVHLLLIAQLFSNGNRTEEVIGVLKDLIG